MTLRIARPDDLDAIVAIHLESWQTAFSKFYPEAVHERGDQTSERYETWQQILSDPQYFVYVREDQQGNLLGMAQGGATHPKWSEPDHRGELHRLYVSSTAQGQGIGRALTVQIGTTLLGQGFSSMLVAAWAVNTPARRFYEGLGAQFLRIVPQSNGTLDSSQALYCWHDLSAWVTGESA